MGGEERKRHRKRDREREREGGKEKVRECSHPMIYSENMTVKKTKKADPRQRPVVGNSAQST